MRGQLGLGTLLPRQTARRRAGAGTQAAEATPRADAPVAESAVSRVHSVGRSRVNAEARTAPGGEANTSRSRGSGKFAGKGTSRGTSANANTNPNGRTAALRYASWDWPITPVPQRAASTDLERIFATWSKTPEAPILAACGIAFDVIEADAAVGRAALVRLDRLGVQLGPVSMAPLGSAAARGTARIGFLVRVGTAAALSTLIDPRTGPVLLGHGDHVELPRSLCQPQPHRAAAPIESFWLRAPSAARPTLPAAHVVLGALALAPHRAPTGISGIAASRVR